jgi:hypothetical protein
MGEGDQLTNPGNVVQKTGLLPSLAYGSDGNLQSLYYRLLVASKVWATLEEFQANEISSRWRDAGSKSDVR